MGKVTNWQAGVERQQNTCDTLDLPQLPPDAVLGLLADCHRHIVVAYLENKFNGKATVEELAAYVSQHAFAGNFPQCDSLPPSLCPPPS